MISLTDPPSSPDCSCLSLWPRYCLPSQICIGIELCAEFHYRRLSASEDAMFATGSLCQLAERQALEAARAAYKDELRYRSRQ
jgi:hypothetical protein